MLKTVRCLRWDGDTFTEGEHDVAEESTLSVFVNGSHFATVMASPSMEREFIIGHLYSENIIDRPEDVESLTMEEGIVHVMLNNPLRARVSAKFIVSGCGGGTSFLEDAKLPKVHSDLAVSKDALFQAMSVVLTSELHKTTGGVHIVGLFDEGGAICLAEDVGRHNAVDKVIGCGLLKNVDFGRTFIVSSGRISSEITLKCSRANIPLAASRGAAMSLAVEIAEKTGVALVSFVRGGRMNIYARWGRVR